MANEASTLEAEREVPDEHKTRFCDLVILFVVALGITFYLVVIAAHEMSPNWLAAAMFLRFQGYEAKIYAGFPHLQLDCIPQNVSNADKLLEEQYLPHFEGVERVDIRSDQACLNLIELNSFITGLIILAAPLLFIFVPIIIAFTIARGMEHAVEVILPFRKVEPGELTSNTEEEGVQTNKDERSTVFSFFLLVGFVPSSILIHRVRVGSDVLATKILAWVLVINILFVVIATLYLWCSEWVHWTKTKFNWKEAKNSKSTEEEPSFSVAATDSEPV